MAILCTNKLRSEELNGGASEEDAFGKMDVVAHRLDLRGLREALFSSNAGSQVSGFVSNVAEEGLIVLLGIAEVDVGFDLGGLANTTLPKVVVEARPKVTIAPCLPLLGGMAGVDGIAPTDNILGISAPEAKVGKVEGLGCPDGGKGLGPGHSLPARDAGHEQPGRGDDPIIISVPPNCPRPAGGGNFGYNTLAP